MSVPVQKPQFWGAVKDNISSRDSAGLGPAMHCGIGAHEKRCLALSPKNWCFQTYAQSCYSNTIQNKIWSMFGDSFWDKTRLSEEAKNIIVRFMKVIRASGVTSGGVIRMDYPWYHALRLSREMTGMPPSLHQAELHAMFGGRRTFPPALASDWPQIAHTPWKQPTPIGVGWGENAPAMPLARTVFSTVLCCALRGVKQIWRGSSLSKMLADI